MCPNPLLKVYRDGNGKRMSKTKDVFIGNMKLERTTMGTMNISGGILLQRVDVTEKVDIHICY